MAGEADFTEQEWNSLHRGLTGAGLLVSLSERGFTSSFKESGAMAKHLAEARTTATSQLVRELAATKGTGWKVASSIEDVRAGTLTELEQAQTILSAKAADELASYRDFVLTTCEVVAAADPRGDDSEAAAIQLVRSALGESGQEEKPGND